MRRSREVWRGPALSEVEGAFARVPLIAEGCPRPVLANDQRPRTESIDLGTLAYDARPTTYDGFP